MGPPVLFAPNARQRSAREAWSQSKETVFADCFGTPVLKPCDPLFHYLAVAVDGGVSRIEASRDVVRPNSCEMIQNDFRLTAREIHAARAIGRECISRNDTR